MDRLTATQVFVAIIEQGSMSSAAKRLDMSRSMVSRYLEQMEQWAGASLLRRSTRKLSLTSSGEKVLAESYKLLTLAEGIPQLAGDATTPQGKLKISCPQSLGEAVLMPFLTRFLTNFPNVQIELDASNSLSDLIEDQIDLAIRISDRLDSGVVAKKLGEINSVICASASYIGAHGNPTHPKELTEHNCLAYTNDNHWHLSLEQEKLVVPVYGNLSVNDNTILLKAALDDLGVILVPDYVANRALKNNQLIEVLPDYRPKPLEVFAVYHSRKQMTPALRSFIDSLSDYLLDKLR